MDSAVLVKSDLEAGWELVNALRNAKFPMTAAFWQRLPDSETWRLFIVTPLVVSKGPFDAYGQLQEQLEQLPDEVTDGFSLANISLVRENSEMVRDLKKRYGTIPWNGAHIRRLSLSTEEAYIYFL